MCTLFDLMTCCCGSLCQDPKREQYDRLLINYADGEPYRALLSSEWSTWLETEKRHRSAQPEHVAEHQYHPAEDACRRLQHFLDSTPSTFDLSNLMLCTLPACWPEHIHELNLDDNRLTELPKGLTTQAIKRLSICFNRLNALDGSMLPKDLDALMLRHNLISTLTELPHYLQRLNLSNNQLTTLPPLPASLQVLRLSNNKITVLPPLPPYLKELRIGGNPVKIAAQLPALKYLHTLHICASQLDNDFACLHANAPSLTRCIISNYHKAFIDPALLLLPNTLEILLPKSGVTLENQRLIESRMKAPSYRGPRMIFDESPQRRRRCDTSHRAAIPHLILGR